MIHRRCFRWLTSIMEDHAVAGTSLEDDCENWTSKYNAEICFVNHTLLIGITGGSASGKSVLAKKLAARLTKDLAGRHTKEDGNLAHACVLAMDHYYRDSSQLSPSPDGSLNFDCEEALDITLYGSHLRSLKSGTAIHRPTYDFATHRRTATLVEVEPPRVLIAEGILLLAIPALRELCDVSAFVDVDAETRLNRRVARDCADEGERQRKPDDVIRQWQATVQPFYEGVIAPSIAEAGIVLSEGSLDEQTDVLLERCMVHL